MGGMPKSDSQTRRTQQHNKLDSLMGFMASPDVSLNSLRASFINWIEGKSAAALLIVNFISYSYYCLLMTRLL